MKMSYKCKCQARTYPVRHFDALCDFLKPPSRCGACGDPKELHVTFAFALGAGTREGKVLDVFRASLPFTGEQKGTAFHPFLVVLQPVDSTNHGQYFWLPYWHTEGMGDRIKIKAGQFAPVMDAYLFENLIGQARRNGYLTDAALLAESQPEG